MKNKKLKMNIEEQINYIEENYDRIFSDLKKFDMFKRSKAKNAQLIPTYIQEGKKLIMIVNRQEMRCYCSDISGLIQLDLQQVGVKAKVVYGTYEGSGKRFSNARFDRHAWLELEDGTIVDGSYIQFQPENKKNPILLKIVRPTDKLFKNFKKDEWKDPEEEPLPYIIEAKNRKYSQRQAEKENAFWRKK